MKPTHKQLELIESMQEYVGELFKGETKADASEYISRHMDAYKLLSADQWIYKNGYQ